MLEEIGRIFIALFVIMDPFGSIPLFLLATQGTKKVGRAAAHATGVAGGVFLFFLFLGDLLFRLLGIELTSLRIGGGLILGALGVEIVLGRELWKPKSRSSALALVGTPMLTGPGVIVSTMIFVNNYGHVPTLLGGLIVLLSSWLVLRLSSYFHRVLGREGIEIVSRVMGLLLVTIAVDLIMSGIKAAL